MRRFLPFLAVLALIGCNLSASVTEPVEIPPAEIHPAGFEGETTMLACPYDRTPCLRVSVIGDGVTIERMRNASGDWVFVTESECRDGHCHVVDEFGTEWKLEP